MLANCTASLYLATVQYARSAYLAGAVRCKSAGCERILGGIEWIGAQATAAQHSLVSFACSCWQLHSTPRQLRMWHASALPPWVQVGHPGAHHQVPPARARRRARQQLPVATQRLRPHDVGALR